jgi:hypothetical protein
LRIKVEKSAHDHTDEEWYDVVDVNLNKETFNEELNNMTRGCIIGVKGRIKRINRKMYLVGERVQVF